MSPNIGPALIAMLGGMRAGFAWCNLNMRAAIADIIHILKAGSCDVVFMHSSAEPMMADIKAAVPTLREIVCLDTASAHGQSLTAWLGDVPMPRWICACRTRRWDSRARQAAPRAARSSRKSDNRFVATCIAGWSSCFPSSLPPVNLALAPITHAGGAIALAIGQFGGTTVMMAQPDVGRMIETIAERQVSILFLPPTLVYMMLAHPRLATTDLSSLRYLMVAAAPFAPEKIIEAVHKLGPVICQAYGSTEGGAPLTYHVHARRRRRGSQSDRRHRLVSCGQTDEYR